MTPLTFNPSGIPDELKTYPNFVLWQRELRDGKTTKVPYQINGQKAASTRAETWTTFPTAVSAYQSAGGKYDGIGFCLTEETPIGIDLDHCRCPAFANQGLEIILPWAQDIIDKIDSYTEASPSGKGIRIFAKGGKLPVGGRKKGDFEIYQSGRYLTVTGNHIAGTPTKIMDRPDIIESVFNEIFGSKKDRDAGEKIQPQLNFNVTEILEKAYVSKTGEQIRKLYNGDYSDYPSQSEADLALCSHLAFWFSNDAGMIDTAFRASGLFRPKWDKRHHADGSTYGQKTIETAIAGNQQTYAQNYTDTRSSQTTNTAENISEPVWEKPVLFGGVFETPEIQASIVPGILGEYCKAVADASQTPEAMSVAMALATVATCIQKRFEVASPTHTEPECVWTLIGSDPGTRKSAVVNGLTFPLSVWEKGQAEILKPEISKVQHTIDVNQERVNQLKKKAAKSDDPSVRSDCLIEIMNIENTTPEPLTVPRLFTDDTTPEKLANLLLVNQERMAVISDEGGTFEVLSGLYSNGKSNVNTYLKAHSGTPVRVDRQLGSVILDKPALSFGLAVQPDVISGLAEGNKAKLRGNGMLARFLYFIPKSNVGSRDVRNGYVIPEALKIEYQNLVFQLLRIAPVFDENGKEQPRILTLSPDALDAWLQFSEYVEGKQGENGELHSIQDWSAKLPGAALRIAGIFHVAEYLERTAIIELGIMERALDLCQLLIPHAKAAFNLMGSIEEVNDAKIVFKWLHALTGDRFTQRDAFQAHDTRFKKMERLKKALGILIERHIISEPRTLPTGGRPSTYHLINPMAREGQV